jgi:hypothetical protein
MRFGIKKVEHIIEHIDQLRAFAADQRGEVDSCNLLCDEEVTA